MWVSSGSTQCSRTEPTLATTAAAPSMRGGGFSLSGRGKDPLGDPVRRGSRHRSEDAAKAGNNARNAGRSQARRALDQVTRRPAAALLTCYSPTASANVAVSLSSTRGAVAHALIKCLSIPAQLAAGVHQQPHQRGRHCDDSIRSWRSGSVDGLPLWNGRSKPPLAIECSCGAGRQLSRESRPHVSRQRLDYPGNAELPHLQSVRRGCAVHASRAL